jgi:hypothetical protein
MKAANHNLAHWFFSMISLARGIGMRVGAPALAHTCQANLSHNDCVFEFVLEGPLQSRSGLMLVALLHSKQCQPSPHYRVCDVKAISLTQRSVCGHVVIRSQM